MGEVILEVKDLRTYFYLDEGILKAVDGVSFTLGRRRTLGIIGESGCGKSVTAQSILKIVPDPGRVVSGEIHLTTSDGVRQNIVALNSKSTAIRSIRGKAISMIFQEPMTSLSPVHTIGNQIVEAILLHRTRDRKLARDIAIAMLDKVGIGNPSRRIDDYPYQLSGGMRQRAMIAMALSCEPEVLIADEPTTALDVTIQAQILELLKSLQGQFGMAILFITHDLGVIAEVTEQVAVMYLGQIVEFGSTQDIFRRAQHPYTRSLLKSIPKLGRRSRGLLEVINGTVPTPLGLPRMCGFFSRCAAAMAGTCDRAVPASTEASAGHSVRCFLYSTEIEKEPEEKDGAHAGS